MKRWMGLVFGLAVAWAQAAVLPVPPEIAARAYLLVDVTTGQVLAQRAADQPVEPASLTKLMTAYVVFGALKSGQLRLDQTISISENAWRTPGSRMFLEPNWQVPVDDLLKGMIVQSGNDATVALAEGMAGSVDQFVALMNQQAQALGLKGTHYTNPEGLTEKGHVTTAQDLATLATRLMRDFPEYLGYYAMQHYRYPNTPKANDTNRNMLLFRDPSVDGLKTGHTEAAGYCLVATAHRPSQTLGTGQDRRLLSVVLGATSATARANESQKLLNWGYTAYRLVRLGDARTGLAQARVYKGELDQASLGVMGGLVVAAPVGQAAAVQARLSYAQPLMAPLSAGQTLGEVTVVLGDTGVELMRRPLQVLAPVPQGGWFKQMWDRLLLATD